MIDSDLSSDSESHSESDSSNNQSHPTRQPVSVCQPTVATQNLTFAHQSAGAVSPTQLISQLLLALLNNLPFLLHPGL